MGVINYSMEITSVIAPSRMFKALVLESHNILPKIVPEGIKSVEFIEGDGGVGSIKQTNFGESSHIKYTKHKIDALDAGSFYCKYTMIESDIKFDKVDFVVEEVKFTAAGSGCVCKMTSEYHVKEGCELKEEDIKKGKDKAMGLYKAVEGYLVANPDVCASMLFSGSLLSDGEGVESLYCIFCFPFGSTSELLGEERFLLCDFFVTKGFDGSV